MANAVLLEPFISKLEGGASNATTDSAHIKCSSGCMSGPVPNLHTNRGATWCTFMAYAKDKNIPKEKWCQLFIEMPDYIWNDIFKSMFWDKINGDRIKSQAIAEYWANATWGNPSTANGLLRDAMRKTGLNVSTDNTSTLVDLINDVVDNYPYKEYDLFKNFVDTRVAWLKSLSGADNNPGWFTRQEKFFNRGKALIRSKLNPANKAEYALLGVINRDYRNAVSEPKNDFVKHVNRTEWMAVVGILGAGLVTGYVIARVVKK